MYCLFEKTENKQKRGRGWPNFFKKKKKKKKKSLEVARHAAEQIVDFQVNIDLIEISTAAASAAAAAAAR